ncbi:glycosyl hydrolase family 65 protein [Roseimaritima sediminicola]|uniref:glycosyl hydrolase family 65 protein n=1 Tax=Roseimaritima sediminicola TaxID=2662066 RepID=UPI00138704D9|nr:glycosyl hydrolase family 65 protein [Roseimaritima sediminicola]
MKYAVLLGLLVCLCCPTARGEDPETTPASEPALPQFIVAGHEREMRLLGDLYELHHSPRVACTLWDAWLPMSTLWPAIGKEQSAAPLRDFYRRSFLRRHIDRQGYVNMAQHRGLAHPGGWPFPTWHQSGGIGFHFTHANDGYAVSLNVPRAGADALAAVGIAEKEIDPARGLVLTTEGPASSLTSPRLRVDTFVSPFVVVEWSGLDPAARPRLQWTTEDLPEFDETRSLEIPLETARPGGPLTFSVVPAYRHPEWKGRLTGLRLHWVNGDGPREIVLRSVHTAVDSRHPITGSLFVRGSCDFFNWTGDLDFLRANIARMRRAISYAVDEFAVEENGCVLVPWVGHGGRTGFVHDPAGKKTILYGRGVGNNYWDLLPFGHKDALATIYLFDAVNALATLEEAVAAHSSWNIPPPAIPAEKLRALAAKMRKTGQQLFWNEANGRFFACIDVDGQPHDYGFTFLNLEAIHYGLASEEQARTILDWITGDRIVEGDTATGKDIYHWRFAPRATTLRNVQWYAYVWHGPDTIPWGGQVQDGGAVLGFSYHDLMARLKTRGPDDAWERLKVILDWFGEVQAEGGYRAYYEKPGRGSLQGGGTPGGLGMDAEFFESVLVPQVMLYGFLGLQPQADHLALDPKLPSSWPELTVTRIHYHDHVFDLRVDDKSVDVTFRRKGTGPLEIQLPAGDARVIKFHSPNERAKKKG